MYSKLFTMGKGGLGNLRFKDIIDKTERQNPRSRFFSQSHCQQIPVSERHLSLRIGFIEGSQARGVRRASLGWTWLETFCKSAWAPHGLARLLCLNSSWKIALPNSTRWSFHCLKILQSNNSISDPTPSQTFRISWNCLLEDWLSQLEGETNVWISI